MNSVKQLVAHVDKKKTEWLRETCNFSIMIVSLLRSFVYQLPGQLAHSISTKSLYHQPIPSKHMFHCYRLLPETFHEVIFETHLGFLDVSSSCVTKCCKSMPSKRSWCFLEGREGCSEVKNIHGGPKINLPLIDLFSLVF